MIAVIMMFMVMIVIWLMHSSDSNLPKRYSDKSFSNMQAYYHGFQTERVEMYRRMF